MKMSDPHDRHYMTLLLWPLLLREQFCLKKERTVDEFILATDLGDVPCMYTPLPRQISDMEQIREVCTRLCTGLDQAGLVGFDSLNAMMEGNRRDLADSVVAVFMHYNIFDRFDKDDSDEEKKNKDIEPFDIDVFDGLNSSKTKSEERPRPNPAFEVLFQKLVTTAMAGLEYPKVRAWQLPTYDEIQQNLAADEMRTERDRKAQAIILGYIASRVSLVICNIARRVVGAQGAFIPSIQRANLKMEHNNDEDTVKTKRQDKNMDALQARALGFQHVFKKASDDNNSFGKPMASDDFHGVIRDRSGRTGVAKAVPAEKARRTYGDMTARNEDLGGGRRTGFSSPGGRRTGRSEK